MITFEPGNVGEAILTLRKLSGMPRRELARRVAAKTGQRLDVLNAQIWTWEAGTRQPTWPTLGPVLAELGYRPAFVPVPDDESEAS